MKACPLVDLIWEPRVDCGYAMLSLLSGGFLVALVLLVGDSSIKNQIVAACNL